MQIDVIGPFQAAPHLMRCKLYTSDRCVEIIMEKTEYENLLLDGFFIRNGKDKDSAGVLNTSEVYCIKKGGQNDHC